MSLCRAYLYAARVRLIYLEESIFTLAKARIDTRRLYRSLSPPTLCRQRIERGFDSCVLRGDPREKERLFGEFGKVYGEKFFATRVPPTLLERARERERGRERLVFFRVNYFFTTMSLA